MARRSTTGIQKAGHERKCSRSTARNETFLVAETESLADTRRRIATAEVMIATIGVALLIQCASAINGRDVSLIMLSIGSLAFLVALHERSLATRRSAVAKRRLALADQCDVAGVPLPGAEDDRAAFCTAFEEGVLRLRLAQARQSARHSGTSRD